MSDSEHGPETDSLGELVNAFADSLHEPNALLVVIDDGQYIRSWYFGDAVSGPRVGSKGLTHAYRAYSKEAEREAKECDEQASRITADDESSARIRRALKNEAANLMRAARDTAANANSIHEAYMKSSGDK